MGVGDPACDLVIAWTFLNKEQRNVFRDNLSLNSETWRRVKGWALWKALITLQAEENKTSVKAFEQKRIMSELLNG